MTNTSNNSLPPIKIPTLDKLFSKAWQHISGLKLSILLTLLVVSICCYLLNLLPTSIHFITVILISLIQWYTSAVLITLGVHQVLGKKITISQAITLCKKSKKPLFILLLACIGILTASTLLSLGAMLVFTFSFLAFLIGILTFCAVIYLVTPIFFFAIPLVIITQCSAIEALKRCYAIMDQCWGKLLISVFLLNILIYLSAIPLGIGLIWTIPMLYTFIGVWFKEITGIVSVQQEQ